MSSPAQLLASLLETSQVILEVERGNSYVTIKATLSIDETVDVNSAVEDRCRDFTCDHIIRSNSKGFRMKRVLQDKKIVGMRIRLRDSEHSLYKLGLRDGNVVLSLSDTPLTGPESLANIYREIRSREALAFAVERDDTRQVFRVRTEVLHQ